MKVMALGSATLFVTASAAMAGVPSNPILGLNGHTATNAYDTGTGYGVYGLSFSIDGGGATFDANGDLTGLADRAACGATNATCKIMDGSGDGMLMYLVTDGSGKKHINQIVGSNTSDAGLFLGELFVEYNGGGALAGGVNIDSMASKYIMKDAAELASAGSGFRLSAEWLRGDYQQTQPSGFQQSNATGAGAAGVPGGAGNGRDLDTVIDMNIGGVVSFHADGITSENGGINQAGMVVDIQSGTNADNTAADAEDAQAMGVFHTRIQGGNAPYLTTNTNIGNTDYGLGSPTITLGTGVLAFSASDGASVTYLHQVGFGFNGSPDEDYTIDHPELRDFSYIRAWRTAGVPSTAIGTFQDPMNGVYAAASTSDGATIAATSQLGSTPMYLTGAGITAGNTAHAPDYDSVLNTSTANDIFAAGTGGEFVGTGASNHDTDDIQAAWLAIFGVAAE
jgi:hypothetical protein